MKSKELIKPSPRERILATAIRLFNLRGIRATGVDTLIADSAVAKMTFYKYFPTKQALVMEYLKERDHLIITRVKQALTQKSLSPYERLLSIFEVLIELYEDPTFRGCVFINAMVEARDPQSEEHLFTAGHKKAFRTLLREVAAEAKMAKPDVIANQLYLLFQGAVVAVQIENSNKPIATAKEIARKCLPYENL